MLKRRPRYCSHGTTMVTFEYSSGCLLPGDLETSSMVQVTTFTYYIDESGAVGFHRRDFQRQQHGVVTRAQAVPAAPQSPSPGPDQPSPGAAAHATGPAEPAACAGEAAAAGSGEDASVHASEAASEGAQPQQGDGLETAQTPLESPLAEDVAAAPALLADEPSATSETSFAS